MNLQPKNKCFFDPEKHEYTDETGKIYPSVTEILSFFGIINTQFMNEESMKFGSVFHKICEIEDLKIWDTIPKEWIKDELPKAQPWLNGYKAFLKDYKPEYSLIEQPLISKGWGFAGCLDRSWGNNLCDIKSGGKADWHCLQLSAYAILVEENYNIKIKKQFGLYVGRNSYDFIPMENKRNIFLSAVNLFHYMKGK